MEMIRFIGSFLKSSKKYWLIPSIVAIILFGAFLTYMSGSVLAPIIYSIF